MSETLTNALVALTGRKYHKSLPDGRVQSILTYPCRDIAGDYVRPDGGNWDKVFKQNPLVNWSHDTPVGRGEVYLKAITHDGRTALVNVGYTDFFHSEKDLKGLKLPKYDDPCTRNVIGEWSPREVLEVAEQAEMLVRDEIATGVSIEYMPDGKRGEAYWDLGQFSVLENRPARHFDHWIGLGYAHTRRPVNLGARTLLGDSEPTIEKAIRIAETKKFGGKELSPIILKAFLEPETLYKPRSYSNGVDMADKEEKKPDEQPKEVVVKGDDSSYNESGGEGNPGQGCAALLNAAQAAMDICESLESEAGNSDDFGVLKFAKKMCGKLEEFAGTVKAYCDKRKAKREKLLKGEEVTEGDDEEATAEEKAIKLDKEGLIILKSFPDWKPRRFKRSEVKDVVPASPATEELADAEEAKAVSERLKQALKKAQEIADALPSK